MVTKMVPMYHSMSAYCNKENEWNLVVWGVNCIRHLKYSISYLLCLTCLFLQLHLLALGGHRYHLTTPDFPPVQHASQRIS